MHTNLRPTRHLAFAAAALLFTTGAALAADPSRDSADAQERYRKEMAVCDSGRSSQDLKTCRTEARNALAEARRGGLSDAPPSQYSRNAAQRCAEFQGDDRKACDARVFNPSRIEGSVEGGGVLRESTILVPGK